MINDIRATERWKKLSLYMRRRYPLCANPLNLHKEIRPSEQVHHIYPLHSHPKLAFTKDNLVCLCTRCHMKIEGMERKGINTQFLFFDDKGVRKSLEEKSSLASVLRTDFSAPSFRGRGCKTISGRGVYKVWCSRMNKKRKNLCGNCELAKNKLKEII